MLPFRSNTSTERPVEELANEALASDVEGVTFLGGEPFAQAAGLALLASMVRSRGLSVMVFSGFTLAELRQINDPKAHELLSSTDLLVDGRYDETRRTTTRRFIGSDNQVLHFLTDRYSPDDPRFSEPNHLEIRIKGGLVTLNGFPVNGRLTLP